MRADFDRQWQELAEEVLSGMKEWRLQHPKATLTEIERALDGRLGRMRVRMLQDAAMASAAADIGEAQEAERPECPYCGAKLKGRGKQTRRLSSQDEQMLILERSYGECPSCGLGVFPPG
jgi:DNA-directed RNA polymerase subunit RPC12/RpoP